MLVCSDDHTWDFDSKYVLVCNRVFHIGTFSFFETGVLAIVDLSCEKFTDFFSRILEHRNLDFRPNLKIGALILPKIEVAQISKYYIPIDAKFYADFKNVYFYMCILNI